MAKTANIFARVDTSLKEQAEDILSQLGMPMSSAINIFLNQIVLHRGLPFEVTLPAKPPVVAGQLTKDEFYEEVKRGHDDLAAGRTRPAVDVFQELETRFDL